MGKNRLEAFSDGVIAILITIMVLELKIPHGTSLAALQPLANVFLSYVLSFIYLGIYWNNHHHMIHLASRINGAILWTNLHLLFWLSLVPFVTGWLGETQFAKTPAAAYGFVLLMCSLAYRLLQSAIIRHQGPESKLHQAVGSDLKGNASIAIYVAAVASTWISEWIAMALYTLVAAVWLVPDRRIERGLE